MIGHELTHVLHQGASFAPAGAGIRGADPVYILEAGSTLTVRVVPAPAVLATPLVGAALTMTRRRRLA